jgi:molybdate transport system ATP-binding protein
MIEVAVARRVGAFDLDVAFANAGGITALFGRSGAGKSMTIDIIAGLARPDRGRVAIDGTVVVDTARKVFVPSHRRRVGLVFQDSHLFPHLSVRQNLMFGRWFAPRATHTIAFEAVVETLGIGHLMARRPARLSGGERQRVAIGRALLSAPRLLLFDEPFAALDMQRRLEILPLIERLRDEFKLPILYVSHALEEVTRLADHVVVLENGRVTATGRPEAVFGPDVGRTAGSRFEHSSVLAVTVAGEDAAYGLTRLEHPAGAIWLAGPAGAVGRTVRLIVRSTDVVLSVAPPQALSVRSALRGAVAAIDADGPFATVTLDLAGEGRLTAMTTRRAIDDLGLRPGDPVFALVKTAALDERSVATGEGA